MKRLDLVILSVDIFVYIRTSISAHTSSAIVTRKPKRRAYKQRSQATNKQVSPSRNRSTTSQKTSSSWQRGKNIISTTTGFIGSTETAETYSVQNDIQAHAVQRRRQQADGHGLSRAAGRRREIVEGHKRASQTPREQGATTTRRGLE